MGIKHLYQLIEEHSPEAVKKGEIKNQFGRKVAIVRPRHSRSTHSLTDLCRMRMHTSILV
jgi:flap endonuclease-1